MYNEIKDRKLQIYLPVDFLLLLLEMSGLKFMYHYLLVLQ